MGASARPRLTMHQKLDGAIGRPWPPSATTTVPVTNEADSWARKSTHAAISAGVPLRPIGPAAAAAASNGNCASVEM
jgi:hypothetical protein